MCTCRNQSLTVGVLDVMEPTPILWNLNSHTAKVNISHPVDLYCESDGSPSPLVTWYKDDLLLRPTGDPNIVINGRHLAIKTFLVNNSHPQTMLESCCPSLQPQDQQSSCLA